MHVDELQLDRYDQKEVFNLLHDVYSEIRIKHMMDINHQHFLYANLSRPVTSASESLMSKKNVILVGAGSGIAPYLPLLEEIFKYDRGKTNQYKFKNATLVFIAREGEQVSWISNYVFHILSCDSMSAFLNIRIYITLEKNSETIPSFLFWRALLLIFKDKVKIQVIQKENEENKEVRPRRDPAAPNINGSLESSSFHSKFSDFSPVSIKFGRPDFRKILQHHADMNENQFDVYACGPDILSNHLYYVCYEMSKKTKTKFKLIVDTIG